jgi:hypothetical protein
MEQRGSHWTDFRETLVFGIFTKPCGHISILIKNRMIIITDSLHECLRTFTFVIFIHDADCFVCDVRSEAEETSDRLIVTNKHANLTNAVNA